jgi:Zn-dependent M28 family amino/carboxypeptidase
VVGILPGKSRTAEHVIFSAHYDHLGIGKPLNGDSIYNGANDDAAGTTGVILLAQHFKKLASNERTLVFAAFTAEETGGFGAQYFSQQLDPETVAAMFNIEMIGTESKWGKNSAYITGFDKTTMGEILQANLKGSAFTFHPPIPTRSSNCFTVPITPRWRGWGYLHIPFQRPRWKTSLIITNPATR